MMYKDAKQSPQLQYAWTPTYSSSTKAEWAWTTELPLKCQSRICLPRKLTQASSSSKVCTLWWQTCWWAQGKQISDPNRYVTQTTMPESPTMRQEHRLRAYRGEGTLKCSDEQPEEDCAFKKIKKGYSTTLSAKKQAERKATLVSGGLENAKSVGTNSEGERLLQENWKNDVSEICFSFSLFESLPTRWVSKLLI